jgi:hypothetical protein
MGDIKRLDHLKYIKFFNNLPKSYTIEIKRQTKEITDVTEANAEEITWNILEPRLDNPAGHGLVFNHILTMIHYIIQEDPELRDEFKSYVKDEILEEVINDSNFNS